MDQDAEKRLGKVYYDADFDEISYPIVRDDGMRLKVVLCVEYVEDDKGHLVEPLEGD